MSTNTKKVQSQIRTLRNLAPRPVPFKKVNSFIEKAIERVNVLDIEPFGSNLPHDYVTCYRSLISHRVTTKYVKPKNRELCRERAFATYKEYEEELARVPSCRTYGDPIGHKAKAMFNEVCRDFNIKDILRNAPIRFSPGETVISLEGETSISAKLSMRQHWTVTSSCFEDAVYLIYNCRGLKQAAKGFIPVLSRRLRNALYQRFKKHDDAGYMVFRYLLKKHVLVIIDGARASSVPKNDKTDRFINIEGFFNILVQASIEWYFRRKLKYYGNSLDFRDKTNRLDFRIRDTQHLHGLLLKDPDVCTIDLKNASDSTLMDRMKLLPPALFCVIARTRSTEVFFPDGTTVFPIKVSSMGNGYTFGLMSFLIYFTLLSHGISANVFGDDIIVHKKDIEMTKCCLSYLGYQLNQTKTFIEHPFRESCGYFYYVGHGYIRSFDITRVTTITEAIVTCNKFFLLWQDCIVNYQFDLADIFETVYKEILGILHALHKGPVPVGVYLQATNLGLYAYDLSFRKKHRKSNESCDLRKKALRVMDLLGLEHSDWTDFVLVPYFKSENTKRLPIASVSTLMRMQGLTGKTIRGKGRWNAELCLVSSTGLTYRFGQLNREIDVDIHELINRDVKLPIS